MEGVKKRVAHGPAFLWTRRSSSAIDALLLSQLTGIHHIVVKILH